MKLKRIFKYYILRESVKEMELNNILDKISRKKSLTEREVKFLNLYQETREEDMKDYLYMSKNSTFQKIVDFLDRGLKVVCDLNDRDGKIGLDIVSAENVFEENICKLTLKGGLNHKLQDKFLYNLIYNKKKELYSLQEQDEYFEKITTGNDD